MKQNARKRLKPSRPSRQGRKHKPRGNRGWVYLHPMFPISLTKYKKLPHAMMVFHLKGGGIFVSQIRRNLDHPQEISSRAWFKLNAKMARFRREAFRDKLPSPPGTQNTQAWLRLYSEMTR